MGVLDIFELLNNPEFFKKIESRLDLFLDRVERIETVVDLIAEKLDIRQVDIQDRIILKRGFQKKEGENAKV